MTAIVQDSLRASIAEEEPVSKLQDEKQQDGPRAQVYEPPTLKVVGTVSGLTLGPTGGPLTDGVFPHHGSA